MLCHATCRSKQRTGPLDELPPIPDIEQVVAKRQTVFPGMEEAYPKHAEEEDGNDEEATECIAHPAEPSEGHEVLLLQCEVAAVLLFHHCRGIRERNVMPSFGERFWDDAGRKQRSFMNPLRKSQECLAMTETNMALGRERRILHNAAIEEEIPVDGIHSHLPCPDHRDHALHQFWFQLLVRSNEHDPGFTRLSVRLIGHSAEINDAPFSIEKLWILLRHATAIAIREEERLINRSPIKHDVFPAKLHRTKGFLKMRTAISHVANRTRRDIAPFHSMERHPQTAGRDITGYRFLGSRKTRLFITADGARISRKNPEGNRAQVQIRKSILRNELCCFSSIPLPPFSR